MSKWITPTVEAPPPRNMTQELDAIGDAYLKYAPEFYDLEAQYGYKYNRLSLANLAESLLGYGDTPGQIELARTAAEQTRGGDISDVERYGGRATNAYLAANPWLAQSLSHLNARTGESDILQQLNRQAEMGLASGGQLSPQEGRMIDQQSRSAFADRGMFGGNTSIASEVLNRDSAVRARQAAAQEFARNVQGLNFAQAGQLGNITQINASALSDPFMAILGRSGGAGATAALSPLNQSRVYSPMDMGAYGADLFNTNYNAGVNIGIAQSNADAATRAAIAEVSSSFIGMSDARLKENIVQVGTSPSGIPIVCFNYRNDPDARRYRGVLAQDVERIKPDAVIERGLVKFVNYEMIDVKFEEAA